MRKGKGKRREGKEKWKEKAKANDKATIENGRKKVSKEKQITFSPFSASN
jgi:hypothetical protein